MGQLLVLPHIRDRSIREERPEGDRGHPGRA